MVVFVNVLVVTNLSSFEDWVEMFLVAETDTSYDIEPHTDRQNADWLSTGSRPAE